MSMVVPSVKGFVLVSLIPYLYISFQGGSMNKNKSKDYYSDLFFFCLNICLQHSYKVPSQCLPDFIMHSQIYIYYKICSFNYISCNGKTQLQEHAANLAAFICILQRPTTLVVFVIKYKDQQYWQLLNFSENATSSVVTAMVYPKCNNKTCFHGSALSFSAST